MMKLKGAFRDYVNLPTDNIWQRKTPQVVVDATKTPNCKCK